MSVICSLCNSFLSLCASNYEQLCSKRSEGVDWISPSKLADNFAHQPTYDMLCASAQNGCHICVLLRLVVNRDESFDKSRCVDDTGETSSQIKLSQRYHGTWFCDVKKGESIHIWVPCGPTLASK